MKHVLTYVRSYKVSTFIALLLMMVELIVELAQPLLMGIIIDRGIIEKDLSVVAGWGSVLLGLSLLAFASGITSSFFAANVSQGVGHDLRRDIFEKIQAFSPINFKSLPTSSLITRVTNDVSAIQGFIFMSLRIMLRAPLFILFGMGMAFYIHPPLAVILLIAVPVLFIIMMIFMTKGVRLFRSVQKKLDSVNQVIRENLVNMRLVKALNRGTYEEEQFLKANTPLMSANKKVLRLMEVIMPVIMFGMNASFIIILWVGSIQYSAGGAQAGELVAVLNYGTKIMFSFSVFSFLIIVFSRGRASATRISDVLKMETIQDEVALHKDEEPIKGQISYQGVSFYYPDQLDPALENVSFSIKEGETVGVLGETGSGKSSLIQLIPKLYTPSKGKVLIDDVDVNERDVQALRRQIGYVPQEAHLFSGTIKENIGWGNEDATEEEIIQAARDAEIDAFIHTLPDGYDTELGQKGVNLSGGQKQRLSIARALVKKPSILILDDSTSALDAHTEAKLLTTLKSLHCTVLIIAQKISSVREADQILLLKEGSIIAEGSHEELLANSSYYQMINNSQVEKGVV